MPANWIFFAELFVLKGALIAFLIREWIVMDRDIKRRRAEKAAEAQAAPRTVEPATAVAQDRAA
ncbi:hypothetical protein CCR85_07810 [Rhodothalassium salexigens]|uniref:hypothetical protein n=1 Tax=Rhodothalassium salexigens TaxID=1086 RepID=UPI0019132BB8|nr:hypothetical protein [Rhodothalassium salexigens]MBK5911398.1 hypothetical protein [Rhodothalassium salexigens]MBK5920225.1 hypothetical protein [Rhodothalassium salexigens]